MAGKVFERPAADADAFAIFAALIYRQQSGLGQMIDLAAQEPVAMLDAVPALSHLDADREA